MVVCLAHTSMQDFYRQQQDRPGKPVAYNNGLLSVIFGPLWSIVACFFRLLGVPGIRACFWLCTVLLFQTLKQERPGAPKHFFPNSEIDCRSTNVESQVA